MSNTNTIDDTKDLGEEYSLGKKACVVVVHQLSVIMMVTSIFAMDYFLRNKIMIRINVCSVLAVLGLTGGFVTLAYLTNVTGRRFSKDYKIYYNFIDRIYSDILVLIFLLLVSGVINTIHKVKMADYDFGSLMMVAATLCYVVDGIFLLLYNSIIRKLKGDILFKHCLLYKIYTFCVIYINDKNLSMCTTMGRERYEIKNAIEAIADGELDTTLVEENYHGQNRELAYAVNRIRDGLSSAVTESTKNERMKVDLITNVSHDIKTPLTSIVNYVNLLKREELNNEQAEYYIRVIDEKSQRLKQLTEDLVEASRISSGNIKLDIQKIDFLELLYQTGGEFNERFEQRNLTIVTKLTNKSCMINADGRQLYRAIENLYTNAAKYALENTRVYVELTTENGWAVFSIKNVSKDVISFEQGNYQNITDRFVRGEVSRTTEGSGLGLSITKNLTSLMGGTFDIKVDGDLFIATISFKIA